MNDRILLEKFFKLNQSQLLKVMSKYLNTKYDKVITTKNYIIAFGNIPVGLIAHLDTVFPTPPKNIFFDNEKNVMWSPEGLGADDRAGVWSIYQIVNQGYRPTIILTTDEEYGGLGAQQLVLDIPEAPTAINYLIEIDRRGSQDFVTYSCGNPLFDDFISSFGFTKQNGSFSDIIFIAPVWNIAACNISAGYYNEHSFAEYLNLNQLYTNVNTIEAMLNTVSPKFDYIEVKPNGN